MVGPHRSFVTQVSWSDTDRFLASACRGGSMIVWSSHFEIYFQNSSISSETNDILMKSAPTSNKFEFARMNVPIIAVAYDDEYDLFIFLGKDRGLEILSNRLGSKYFYYKFEDVIPTCLTLCKLLKVIFIGLSDGRIRIILWPTPKKFDSSIFHDFHIHTKEVSSIKVSYDLKYLISASKDGTLVISKISEVFEGMEGIANNFDTRRKKGDIARTKPHEIMDGLCLTYRSAMKDKIYYISKLKEDLKNVRDMGTEKESIMKRIHKNKVEEITNEYHNKIEEGKRNFRKLQEQYESECKKTEAERHRLIEANLKTIEKIETRNKTEQRAAFDLNNYKINLLETQKTEFLSQINYIQNYLFER